MQTIPHRALQGGIQATLNASKAPAAGALQQGGDGCGHQRKQQGPGGGAPHHQHAGEVDPQGQQCLSHAHRLIQAQGCAIDVDHQQGQQIAPADLLQLGGGGGEDAMQQLLTQSIGKPRAQPLN